MSDNPKILPDLGQLSMTEIIRYQGLLQQELTRRFERQMVLVFSDIVGSTPYFARFGDAAGRQLQQLHYDLLLQGITPHGVAWWTRQATAPSSFLTMPRLQCRGWWRYSVRCHKPI